MKPTFQSLALSLGLLLAGCSTKEVTAAGPLRFSAIPDQNSTELKEKFDRVAGYLTKTLGVTFEYVPSTDYGASVEAFKNGDIHLAWFGGLSGVRARAAVPGAKAIAQGTVDPRFKSYFIAHSSLGLSFSQDFPMGLEGKSFTFGSQGSTSGRLMPEHHIRRATGSTPDEFFSEIGFSGSHDKTALQVQEATYQSGALNYLVYDELVAQGKIDPELCVKVWETPPYPDYNWTAHPELEQLYGAGFIDRLQEAILGMSDPELLAAAQRKEGFIKASNQDFEPLEELARELDLLR